MRYSIKLFILILLGCSSKPENCKINDGDNLMCYEETKEATELLNNDTVQLILINEFPPYEKELNKLLTESNVQLRLIASMHGEGSCLRAVMDSVINERFGSDFRTKILNEAGSLFLESNKDSIFQEQQLDKRPTLASNSGVNGQDEIIKRLNSKFSNDDTIELISNIVNSPYFKVKFKVSTDGTSSNAEIIERNSTDDFTELERIIINEINGLTDWTAGQIRNESVSSTIEIAIAVNKKRNANKTYE